MSTTRIGRCLAIAAAAALTVTGLGLAAPATGSTVVNPTNTTPVTIPATGDSGSATAYPSTVAVSGVPKGVIDVNVVLTGLSHTYAGDIDMLLVGPAGQQATILSDENSDPISVANLVLDQSATAGLPDPIVSGTFAPSNLEGTDTFDPPAPVATGSSNLDVFNGTDPNGTWSLYVMDDAGGDTGSLASWGLQITTQDVPASPVISAPAVGTRDRDGAFTVAGSAPAGSTVNVLVDGVLKGTATASAVGQWAAPVSGVHNGTHAVTATATDGFGNVSPASAARSVVVDSIRPTVVATVPSNKAKHASTTANVKAKASEAVRKLTVTKANAFIVVAGTTKHLKAKVTWKPATNRIVINPKADLANGTTYKVTITTKVLDLAGNPLDQNKSKAGVQKKTWKFTTK